MDYYKEKFNEMHKEVHNNMKYVGEKLGFAKDKADDSFVKQLEAEYYALQVIRVRMNGIKLREPKE